MKSRGIKVIVLVVLLAVSGVVYTDINYERIGHREKLYYYLLSFLAPAN